VTDTRQQKQIEALTAALQKVSAQLEVSKPAPQNSSESLELVDSRTIEPSCFTAWRLFVSRGKLLPLFEIALVLMRLDHVASRIVDANHGIM
jgi:hypothetical protein